MRSRSDRRDLPRSETVGVAGIRPMRGTGSCGRASIRVRSSCFTSRSPCLAPSLPLANPPPAPPPFLPPSLACSLPQNPPSGAGGRGAGGGGASSPPSLPPFSHLFVRSLARPPPSPARPSAARPSHGRPAAEPPRLGPGSPISLASGESGCPVIAANPPVRIDRAKAAHIARVMPPP